MSDCIKSFAVPILICIGLAGCGGRDNPFDYSERNQYSQQHHIATIEPDIYCNCGSTTATQSSVPEGIEDIELVDGVLVKVAWKDIEPEPGVFDFSLIDSQLALAEGKGMRVSLAVTNGPDAPPWLATEGAVFFEYGSFIDETRITIPALWDAVYLARYRELIAALGKQYDGHPAVRLLHMTQSTTNGFDSQFLLSQLDSQRFFDLGYTPERYLESWKKIIDAHAESFSFTPVDMDVHPVFGNSDLSFAAAQYGLDTLGERFGVFAAWWSYQNAELVYPQMFNLIAQVARQTFSTVQLIAPTSVQLNPSSFTEEEFLLALELARNAGVTYIEVWKQDLFNVELMLRYSDSINASFNRTIAH